MTDYSKVVITAKVIRSEAGEPAPPVRVMLKKYLQEFGMKDIKIIGMQKWQKP